MHRRSLLALFLAVASTSAHADDACRIGQSSFVELHGHKEITLRGPLDPAALERENMVRIQESGELLPFGKANQKWRSMKAKMTIGDSIYFMERKSDRFYMSAYILVRQSCVIDLLLEGVS
jgi:hypothetical protein